MSKERLSVLRAYLTDPTSCTLEQRNNIQESIVETARNKGMPGAISVTAFVDSEDVRSIAITIIDTLVSDDGKLVMVVDASGSRLEETERIFDLDDLEYFIWCIAHALSQWKEMTKRMAQNSKDNLRKKIEDRFDKIISECDALTKLLQGFNLVRPDNKKLNKVLLSHQKAIYKNFDEFNFFEEMVKKWPKPQDDLADVFSSFLPKLSDNVISTCISKLLQEFGVTIEPETVRKRILRRKQKQAS